MTDIRREAGLAPAASLVMANRILSDHGILDAFGHVSIRCNEDPGSFLLARNMAPALVTESDVQRVALDGSVADERPSYLERFIHGEIYSARPDVMAVVHSHSAGVLPFSLVSKSLVPVIHMAGYLGGDVPVFDMRKHVGDGTDLLVQDRTTGAKLAEVLGDGPAVLMRGHGSTVVAGSLQEAVYRAVYLEVNARTQASAMLLGAVTALSKAEAAAAAASIEQQAGRAWELWSRRVVSQPGSCS